MAGKLTDYDQIYRDLHPITFPWSPYDRQLELRDLWPSDQERFRKKIDTIGRALEQSKE